MKKLLVILLTISSSILASPNLKGHTKCEESNLNILLGGAYATFAGKFGGNVTLNDLKNTNTIGIAGCASGSKILKYDLIINSGSAKESFKCEGHLLETQIIEKLKLLEADDSFEFANMKARLPEGRIIDVMCKTFKVIG